MTLEEYKKLIRTMSEAQKLLGPICNRIEARIKEWFPEAANIRIRLFEDSVKVEYDGSTFQKVEAFPIERFFHEEDR